ncbi:hypothetical protein DIURU_004593 [Diutina rugosa]|uniref:Globin domain-containing protein n=1 Tax=Diutina rugosa TaxID=5481 RepID=A0A642UJ68_DIURU|nr:uncharacterized protein DIURU_004593 [Diutina rugosa]KAA8898749.1 hypothetical protein DIURU_004593 [Diutina rugosa]
MDLTRGDIRALRASWSQLSANPSLFDDVFHHMELAHPAIAPPATEARQFSVFFGHCVSQIESVDAYIISYVRKHPQFARNMGAYVEPLGSVLVTSFKHWVGGHNFDKQLETAWVKFYCTVANDVMEAVDSLGDASSTYSAEAPSVAPSVAPSMSTSMSTSMSQQSITFNLKQNDKYRGFRRSVNEAPNANLSVKIPPSPSFKALSRAPSVSSHTSSRNSSRSSSQGHHRSFDPRVRKSASVSSLSLATPQVNEQLPSPELSPTRYESKLGASASMHDLSQSYNPYHRSFDPRKQGHSRRPTADDLAPIRERIDVDDVTSKYSDEDYGSHKSSIEEVSSGASTLSLRRSSASSSDHLGSSPSPDLKHNVHVRSPSATSSISYMRPLASQSGRLAAAPHSTAGAMPHGRFGRSTTSLLSDYSTNTNSTGRVSAGFMRSSFVLKQEMEGMGYQAPEQFAKPPVKAQRQQQMPPLVAPVAQAPPRRRHSGLYNNASAAQSEVSVRQQPRSHYGRMPNVYEEEPQAAPMSSVTDLSQGVTRRTSVAHMPSTPKMGAPSMTSKMSVAPPASPSKKGFRAKIKSIFGGGSKSNPPSPRQVSAPIPIERPMASQATPSMARKPSMPGARRHGRNGSVSTSSIQPPPSLGYSSMASPQSPQSPTFGNHRNYSTTDLQSNYSAESTTSGFSFFSRRSRGPKKANKYQVHSVPYSIWARGVPSVN